jgi:ABC-2 type transport system permease protein
MKLTDVFSAPSGRSGYITQFLLICGLIAAANVIANFLYTKFDLTEEKRFTLTQPTRDMLRSIDDRIFINVLLEGEFPAGFKRLQEGVRETLDDFRSETGFIDYQFEDPGIGSAEELNSRRKALAEEGIQPVNLKVMDGGETTQKLIYPVAIVHYGERRVPIKLLENETAGFSNEEILNNSVALLEYKLASAIKKIRSVNKPTVLFTTGHGELNPYQTADLIKSLTPFYETGNIVLDSVLKLDPKDCALLVIAKPRTGFSEKEKFKIDQFIMQGGRTLWMIDRLNAELDSMAFTGKFVPSDYPLNLEDMLFKYGVRVMPDIVLDLSCTKIPMKVGQLGNAPQMELFKWFYFPAVTPDTDHPVAKNLDRIEMKFCNSIDTVDTRKTNIKKTTLLRSSQYSRVQFSPMELNFEILRYEPDPSKFDKGKQNLAVLLEGNFLSNYENRITQEMRAGLQQVGISPLEKGEATKMIIVSDGDIAANYVRDTATWLQMGYNRFENTTYANKSFVLNCFEYLTDPHGVIEARAKEVKLRLLDNVRTQDEKPFWQALNIGLPLLMVSLLVLGYRWWRRRKYARMPAG